MKCSYDRCKNEVKWRFSPDIDIVGLLSCNEHKENVRMAYITLIFDRNEDMCVELLNRKKTAPV